MTTASPGCRADVRYRSPVSATSTDDAAQRRAARRRRLQQRQTVILGGLVTVLLVVGLVALAMWTGLLPAPFSREFSAEEEETTAAVQPCPPPDAVPVEPGLGHR